MRVRHSGNLSGPTRKIQVKRQHEVKRGRGRGERVRERERELWYPTTFRSIYPSLTTFADMLQSLVKSPQMPVDPVPLVVKRQSPQLVEKRQILLWIFLWLFSHEQDQWEVVHPQGHVVKLVDINQEESVLQCIFSSQGVTSTITGCFLCPKNTVNIDSK